MTSVQFTAKRVTRTYCQTIDAPPEQVFPLICPAREAEWLDGWQFTMIRSESGLVEEGAVFSTPSGGEPDTVWIVTRHDPVERVVEFARFTPGSRVCLLRVVVRPRDTARSAVDISYTYTGLTAAGNAFVDNFTEESFLRAVTFWEKSMNYWLSTGEKLRR